LTRSTYSGNPIWDILGIPCVYQQEADSSIFLVNRKFPNVNLALKTAMFLQQDWQLYSRLVAESFDILRLTFRAVSAEYTISPHIPAYAGGKYMNKFCGRAQIQYHPRPRTTEVPDGPNILLLRALDDGEKNTKPFRAANIQLLQYFPNYLSNYAWNKVKGKCHQLIQYSSNYFNGIPPKITVFDEIIPGLARKLEGLADSAANLNSRT
jgi:hypothetical protein